MSDTPEDLTLRQVAKWIAEAPEKRRALRLANIVVMVERMVREEDAKTPPAQGNSPAVVETEEAASPGEGRPGDHTPEEGQTT